MRGIIFLIHSIYINAVLANTSNSKTSSELLVENLLVNDFFYWITAFQNN